jgi:hypothetical protein
MSDAVERLAQALRDVINEAVQATVERDRAKSGYENARDVGHVTVQRRQLLSAEFFSVTFATLARAGVQY